VIGSILVYDFEPKPPPRDDHAHLRERHVEQRGELGPYEERVLAGGVHRDLARLDLRHDRVRLHRVLVDRGERVLALHDLIRVGEDRLDLAAVDAVAVAGVALERREHAESVEEPRA
jgi:hypothetical protein